MSFLPMFIVVEVALISMKYQIDNNYETKLVMISEQSIEVSMKSKIADIASKMLKSKAMLVGAGAGIGRDSGLPDFRGNEGFWNNYPPYRGKFDFYSCANPEFLRTNPDLFWGFYGSRLIMYRQKIPHEGFHILKQFANDMKHHFYVTSNVDGHFQKVFPHELVYEVHGSIHHLQCSQCCTIVENSFQPDIDYNLMACRNVPKCQKCNQNMRPNILMFGDWGWLSERCDIQSNKYSKFLSNATKQKCGMIIFEIGCGTAVPTIRNICEGIYYQNKNSVLVRINPDEESDKYAQRDSNRFIHLKMGALDALQAIKEEMQRIKSNNDN